MKWGEASNLAISGGGHLAVMSNKKEMAYTHRLLQGVLKKQKSCWIGGRKNSEDEWENVTRESFDFLNWLPGQPDNFGEGEEFLVIRKMDGQVGANDESGTQEPVNFLLIEWSHPSQRNFSAVAKAPEDEPTALEKAFAEVRMDIINKHQEGEVKISTTTDQTENWKKVRNGLIIFTILHLLLEVSIGDPQTVGISVAFNYFVARWYLKRQINKGVHKDNYTLFGFLIALAVFGIRFFLGVSLILLLQ